MPGLSGYEVCERLRELYPSNSLPIIMISAKSTPENIVQGLESGSNDYMAKASLQPALGALLDAECFSGGSRLQQPRSAWAQPDAPLRPPLAPARPPAPAPPPHSRSGATRCWRASTRSCA